MLQKLIRVVASLMFYAKKHRGSNEIISREIGVGIHDEMYNIRKVSENEFFVLTCFVQLIRCG